MTIDVDQVGRYFVQLYYETLNKDPKEIGRYGFFNTCMFTASKRIILLT